MSKVCHIVGGGDFFGIRPTGEGDFIIAADKGLLYLQNLGITPNLVIGDFDSLGHTPNGRNIIVLPCEKNDTDMGAAVAEGVMRGYKKFHSLRRIRRQSRPYSCEYSAHLVSVEARNDRDYRRARNFVHFDNKRQNYF